MPHVSRQFLAMAEEFGSYGVVHGFTAKECGQAKNRGEFGKSAGGLPVRIFTVPVIVSASVSGGATAQSCRLKIMPPARYPQHAL